MIFVSFSIEKTIIPCFGMPPLPSLTSCTPIKSNLYLANSLAAAVSEPAIYRLLYSMFQISCPFLLRSLYHCVSPGPRLSVWMFCNKIHFYGEELLAPSPTPKLEDCPLLAVRDCLFSIFTPTILEVVPPAVTWWRATPWWQRPTFHGWFNHTSL